MLIFFTEVTFPDGGLNGAENGSLPNHEVKRCKFSFNDTEGRVCKLNSCIFQKSFKLQPISMVNQKCSLEINMTGSVYRWHPKRPYSALITTNFKARVKWGVQLFRVLESRTVKWNTTVSYSTNLELPLIILTCLLVLTFLKGPLTCDQMEWQDEAVPDGIRDDRPLNDVARSHEGGTQVILDKWGSKLLFLHYLGL